MFSIKAGVVHDGHVWPDLALQKETPVSVLQIRVLPLAEPKQVLVRVSHAAAQLICVRVGTGLSRTWLHQ